MGCFWGGCPSPLANDFSPNQQPLRVDSTRCAKSSSSSSYPSSTTAISFHTHPLDSESMAMKCGIVGPDLCTAGCDDQSWVGHGDRSGPYLGGANPDANGVCSHGGASIPCLLV